MIRLLADEARKELGLSADRGTSAPAIKHLNNTLDRLAGIVRLMDEVVLPVLDLAPIPHASEIEKRIVGKLVTDLLAAGYTLSVYDGEETTVEFSTDPKTIFEALASTDSDILYANMGAKRSFVLLVWGNGCDVISDYGISLEGVLKPANDLAEALQ